MKIASGIFISLVLILLTAEGILRGQEFLLTSDERSEREELRSFLNNIFSEVIVPGKDHVPFFHPPFKKYYNYGYQDEKRLEMIFQETLGPVGKSVRTNDPLMPKSREKFKVSLNKLGFRGENRSPKKSPDVKRIIVLGSYQAWGLGVNDSETYSALLENYLNQNTEQKKYEVWNGGRMTSTAIIGLAHLKHNVLKYQPDLVILDYGFVDSMMLLENKPALNESPFIQRVISYSYLLQKMRMASRDMSKADPLPNFRGVMNEMISLLRQNNVQVILVQQKFESTLPAYFLEARKDGVPVVTVSEIINKDAYKNPFQLNTTGHSLLALELKKLIE